MIQELRFLVFTAGSSGSAPNMETIYILVNIHYATVHSCRTITQFRLNIKPVFTTHSTHLTLI